MPDNNEEELEVEHQSLSPEVQAMLRQGRKAQRDLEAKNIEVESLARQTAIAKAGIPDHPARDVVFEKYDGPLDEASLKAHAEKFGISAPVPLPPTSEEQAQRRILDASGGGFPTATGDIDLAVAFRNAKSQAEVLNIIAQVQGTPGFKNHDGLIGVLPNQAI